MASPNTSSPSNDSDPDKTYGKGPAWAFPFVMGTAITALGYRFRKNIEAKQITELNSEVERLTKQQSVLTTATIKGGDVVFANAKEAISAIESGKVSPKVYEAVSPDGQTFSYFFTGTSTSTDTNATAKNWILRGVPAGEGRDNFLTAVHEKQGTVEAILTPKQFATAAAQSVIEVPSTPEPREPMQASSAWYEPLIWPVVMLAGVAIFSRYIGRGLKSLGESMGASMGIDSKSNLNRFSERPSERFKDVGGNQTVITEMRHMVDDIRAYQRGDPRAKIPKGVLLHGGPGVGKTFTGRVIAGEADSVFAYMNAGDLQSSSYIGAWTRAVKKLFVDARSLREKETARLRALPGATGKEQGVVVVFLDEFDSIGKARDGERDNGNDEHNKAVNGLLAEFDGVDAKRNAGIIVMAATNHPDTLDKALLRPGRFTRRLEVLAPQTKEERLDVLQKITPKILSSREASLEKDSLLEDLARVTPEVSPDHLRGIMEDAIELAHRDKRAVVSSKDIFEAYQREMFGFAQPKSLATESLRQVSRHEHGHGLAAAACGRDALVVSMVRRGESYGRVVVDEHPLSENIQDRNDLLMALVIAAGGRAAELVGTGKGGQTSGVGGDFQRMDEIARTLIDSGMLSEGFGPAMKQANSWDLPPDYRALVQQLRTRAIDAASKVIEAAGGKRTLEKCVDESLSLDHELVGDEARMFYRSLLSSKQTAAMKKAIEEFLESPLPMKVPEALRA